MPEQISVGVIRRGGIDAGNFCARVSGARLAEIPPARPRGIWATDLRLGVGR